MNSAAGTGVDGRVGTAPSCRTPRQNLCASGLGTALVSLAVLCAVCAVTRLAPASAVEPFFAPAVPMGTLAIRLQPTAAVAPGAPVLITFGVPFPRGSLTAEAIGTVRVLAAGEERPAHVDALTLWRHATNAAVDGASIRVIRVQLEHAFATSYPASEEISLEWGQAPRTKDVAELADPRTAWHLVTDGTTPSGGITFDASHQVWEPDVYAVLPKAWLSASGLKTPMQPLDGGVSELRMEPSAAAASYPGHLEADHAQVNFFYSIINDDDLLVGPVDYDNTNAFTSDYEPWLYDRAMALYVGYLRSGFFRFLREAVRNAEFYRTKIYTPAACDDGPCVGSFSMKNPDPAAGWHDEKYSYNESLAMTYWLTGDAAALPYVEYVTRIYDGVSTVASSSAFTERHAGLKLMSRVVAYEVTGGEQYRDEMAQIIADFRAGQTNPYGGLADGGLWHSIAAHEGVESTEPITSPWMSALIGDAAARAYLVSEHVDAARLIIELATHQCGAGGYWTTIRDGENGLDEQSGEAPLFFPHYLATRDGLGWSDDFNPYTDYEHSFDVAGTVAWGTYFARLSGEAQASEQLRTCAEDLYTTFSHTITYWTRPGGPAANKDGFRVVPHRKYSWWFKNASGFQWAMASSEGPAVPIAYPFAASVVLGLTVCRRRGGVAGRRSASGGDR